MSNEKLVKTVLENARPLDGQDEIVEIIGDARVVCIGEASHGTHEFYRKRAEITKRLIKEKGFTLVAVEADWPDAYRINRFVRCMKGFEHETALSALDDFERFPRWMWRNADVLDFIGWMRELNESRRPDARAGFYGLDLYSLNRSMDAVIRFLEKVDPAQARLAKKRYGCFDELAHEAQDYTRALIHGLARSCEEDVLDQLLALQQNQTRYLAKDDPDEYFQAEQNARVATNAEQYYRTMFFGSTASWNLRDEHMFETAEKLLEHHGERSGRPAKMVIWAHNSHLGDGRATQFADHDQLNLGQLVREEYGDRSRLIGFTTHHGTVAAASDWDGAVERKTVRPSLPASWEAVFHHTGLPRFFLHFAAGSELSTALSAERRLERAIGVIYRPETERASHYFFADLPSQFDVVIHFDRTRALEPLDRFPAEVHETPETFPSGL